MPYTDCNYKVIKYALLRLLVTIVACIACHHLFQGTQYYLFLLVVFLVLTDSIDSVFLKESYKCRCCATFTYQLADKVNDVLAYILTLLLLVEHFPASIEILACLVMYRIIGVILFGLTRKSVWLIVFFDFVKEFVLYSAIMGSNYMYVYPFVLAKIGFEYYHHTKVNKTTSY